MKNKSKIFDLSAISIIACDCLQGIILIFVDLFLVANILKNDLFGQAMSYNVIQIGLFYIIYYLTLGLSYLFSGHFLKNHNKSIFVSIGSILLTGTILLIYFLGDNLIVYLPLVAFLFGFSYGFYSSGYHNLTAETISSKHQVRFFAVKRMAYQGTYIVFPIAIGYIVDVNFSIMALIMVFLCVALVVFSFLIRPKKVYKLSFNLVKFGKYLNKNKQSTEPLKFTYLSNFFRGASCDCFTTLATILVVVTFGSNSSLGTLQSIFTLCSLGTMFLYLRYYRKKRAQTFLLPSVILVASAVVGIVATMGTSMVAIVIFYAIYTILNTILISVSDSRRASVARTLSLHSHILENTTYMELTLAAGRVFSSILLVLSGVFDGLLGGNSIIFVLVTMGVVALLYVFFGLSLIWVEKSLILQDEQFHKIHINEIYEKIED